MPEKFLPDGTVTIGEMDSGERKEEYQPSVSLEEAYGSLFEYANSILGDSDFEIHSFVEGSQGPTTVYEGENSVIAVSDAEGLGIDLYEFDGEPDVDVVVDHLKGELGRIPGVENDIHRTLHGDEAYDEIHRLLELKQ